MQLCTTCTTNCNLVRPLVLPLNVTNEHQTYHNILVLHKNYENHFTKAKFIHGSYGFYIFLLYISGRFYFLFVLFVVHFYDCIPFFCPIFIFTMLHRIKHGSSSSYMVTMVTLAVGTIRVSDGFIFEFCSYILLFAIKIWSKPFCSHEVFSMLTYLQTINLLFVTDKSKKKFTLYCMFQYIRHIESTLQLLPDVLVLWTCWTRQIKDNTKICLFCHFILYCKQECYLLQSSNFVQNNFHSI